MYYAAENEGQVRPKLLLSEPIPISFTVNVTVRASGELHMYILLYEYV